MLEPNLTPDVAELVSLQRQWSGRDVGLFTNLLWGSREITQDARKCAALDRRVILRGDFAPLVVRKLQNTHHDLRIIARIRQHINVSMNVGADITTAVACCYKQGARRNLRGASETKRKDFADLNRTRRIETSAQHMNRLAFMVGPVLEVPFATPRGVRSAIFSADEFDVSVDPADPLGPPLRVAFPWLNDRGRKLYVVLDPEARHVFNDDGLRLGSFPHGVKDAEGRPTLPATVWRLDHPTDIWDWWCWRRNMRLVDSTVACAFVHTQMDFIRKSQNKKFATFFADLETFPKGQLIDSEVPIVKHQGPDEVAPDFEIHDFDTPIDNFITHIMFEYRAAIEAYGIPQSSLTFDFGNDGATPASSLAIQHERLSQLRNEQLPFMREAERRSAYMSTVVSKAAGQTELDPAEVWEKFEIEFPELNRVDEPDKLQSWWEWQISRSQKTEIDLYMSQHDVTREEARRAIEANVTEQADVNDIKTTRNHNPGQQMETAAQANGAMGPQVRDQENEPSDHGDPSPSE